LGHYFEVKGRGRPEGEGLCLWPLSTAIGPAQPVGTATRSAKSSPALWDAFSDVDVVVDKVLTELAALAADGTRPTRPGPKPPRTGAALHKAVMAIWCVGFCGMGAADRRDVTADLQRLKRAEAVRPEPVGPG
jgi:hypothetical protein